MNLYSQAETDLNFMLEDANSGFAIAIQLIDPNNNIYDVFGQPADIGFFIDSGTGVGTRGRIVEINLRLSTIQNLGIDIPEKSDNWKFKFVHNNETWFFAIQYAPIDRTLGIIKLQAELLNVEYSTTD